MRPGQLTPENDHHGAFPQQSIRASMRPGQLTPENLRTHPAAFGRLNRFNEAGAINPGKLDMLAIADAAEGRASMRPGQLTPENGMDWRMMDKEARRFNEAGAINPGKRLRNHPLSTLSFELQ